MPSSPSPVGCRRQKAASIDPITECMQAASRREEAGGRVCKGGCCGSVPPRGGVPEAVCVAVGKDHLIPSLGNAALSRQGGAHPRWRRAPQPAGARGSGQWPAPRPVRCSACPPASGAGAGRRARGQTQPQSLSTQLRPHTQSGRLPTTPLCTPLGPLAAARPAPKGLARHSACLPCRAKARRRPQPHLNAVGAGGPLRDAQQPAEGIPKEEAACGAGAWVHRVRTGGAGWAGGARPAPCTARAGPSRPRPRLQQLPMLATSQGASEQQRGARDVTNVAAAAAARAATARTRALRKAQACPAH